MGVPEELEGAFNKELERIAGELVETKNFFNSIIESSADAIVASDLDKNITYFSMGAEALFGYRSEEVLGKKVLTLYPRERLKKEERMKRARELKKLGFIRNIILDIYIPSGEKKTISLTLSLLKDLKGRLKGTVGIAKDISKETADLKELIDLKTLNERIFEGIPEGLILLNLDYRISYVNKGFERITGIKQEPVIGKYIGDSLSPVVEHLFEKMRFKEKFIKVKENGRILEPKEFTLNLQDTKKTFTDYWTPLIDDNGDVERVLIILRDMTKRKNLERNLRDQATRLKHSNELKALFSDIMSHDLLNPIGVIRNYIELIPIERETDPMLRQCLDAISRNTNKAIEMINTAARFAKIEDEKDIGFEERDIVNALNDVLAVAKAYADKKEIKFVLKAPESYLAVVNPFIEDVFSNLISNAIKYAPENTSVTIELSELDMQWKVSVTDRGEGVPDKFKKLIFTRFERLKKEGVNGTGLGLAILKRIVDMHKGKTWVEDNPDGGSIFLVEIPKDLK